MLPLKWRFLFTGRHLLLDVNSSNTRHMRLSGQPIVCHPWLDVALVKDYDDILMFEKLILVPFTKDSAPRWRCTLRELTVVTFHYKDSEMDTSRSSSTETCLQKHTSETRLTAQLVHRSLYTVLAFQINKSILFSWWLSLINRILLYNFKIISVLELNLCFKCFEY